MMNQVLQVLKVVPEELKHAVLEHPAAKTVEELRLRRGMTAAIISNGKEYFLKCHTSEELMQGVLDRATQRSQYAVMDMLRMGYMILPGGHRMGICGTGVYRDGVIRTMRDISSLNIRVARQIKGAAAHIVHKIWSCNSSVLCIGPPGSGKTTLLRDLIHQLSSRYQQRVAVVDERRELAASLHGLCQFDLGPSTDVLSSVGKAEGIEMLLRSMSPQWIALDEITAQRDVQAIVEASYCGVKFLATAHGDNMEDLRSRPIYRELLKENIFHMFLFLDRNKQIRLQELIA